MFSYRRFFLMHRVGGSASKPASGPAFPVTEWTRLDRFLVLGSEGGSYNVNERAPTLENAQATIKAIKSDGERAVARIAEVSRSGRAPKNDPAIFALALAASLGNGRTKSAAMDALPKVCRTATHLLQFAEAVERLRGGERGLRRGIAAWYTGQSVDDLAREVIKDRQRGGPEHRDLLRLAQPLTHEAARKALFDWISRDQVSPALPETAKAFLALQRARSVAEVVTLIRKHDLPREAVPAGWLNDAKVWRALVERMPMPELIRDLGKFTAAGLLEPLDDELNPVLLALRDRKRICKARVHPFAILFALKSYAQGRCTKGRLVWEPAPQVTEALNAAFYTAFDNVEATGRRIMLALDVSDSMAAGGVAGTSLSPREGSAAVALMTAATEESCHIAGFTAEDPSLEFSQRAKLTPLPIAPGLPLANAMRAVSYQPFGETDCALPMLHALEQGISVDAFVVYTDSVNWSGKIQPAEALREYRRRTGIPAKLVVVGMVGSRCSVADPNDGGMLDVVGFDAAAPALIADFIRA
jgi:60 kDa SS-A/Ro ribonucleoprotein